VRTLTNPLSDLGLALTEQLGPPIDNSNPDLIRRIATYAGESPLVIAFDQFEEFFIRFRNNPDLRTSFISMIAELASSDVDCRILFSVREDYLANFDEFRRRLPGIFDNSYRVGPLSAFGAREAITRPLLHRTIPFDNLLIGELLEHLAKFNFDPAFLQIVCGELVRVASLRDPQSLNITSEDLHSLGGIEGIFERYLDNAIDELPSTSRLMGRLVLDALISQDRSTKQAMRIEDLLVQDFVTNEEELATILAALNKFRIVRRDTRGSEDWFELVHERLVPIIQRWIRADTDYFNFVAARDLVEFAGRTQASRTNPEALLNRGQIEYVVRPYAARLRFDHAKVQFVLLSCIYRASPEINYWFMRYDRERGMHLLLTTLSSNNDRMRLGAMIAIKRLEDAPSAKVLTTCLTLSIHDPNEPVRRAAGIALGRQGDETHLTALNDALHREETRTRALEVCADVLSTGRTLPTMGILPRFRAHYIVRRRQLRANREVRLGRAYLGMLYGAAGGVVWSLTISPLLLLIVGLIIPPNSSFFSTVFVVAMAIAFPAACIIGALLGRTLASSAARRDLLGRRENYLLDLVFAKVYWGYILISAPIIYFIYIKGIETSMILATAALMSYVAVSPALAIAFGRECIRSESRSVPIVIWGSFAIVVISAFAAAALVWILSILDPDPASETYHAWMFLTIWGSTIGAISLSALTFPRLKLPFKTLVDQAETKYDGGPSGT
jgi:hypothetical protein